MEVILAAYFKLPRRPEVRRDDEEVSVAELIADFTAAGLVMA